VTDVLKLKVVLVGPPGVGKTSLVRRYVLNAFDDRYRTTLGANVYKWSAPLDVGDRAIRVAMTVWDTAGESLPDGMLEMYLYGAQGVLAVCDVTDTATATGLDPWISATRNLADVPVHILLNKADLGPRDALLVGLEAAREQAHPCYVTSAKTGDNVAAAFQDLARRIVVQAAVPPSGPVDDLDKRIALSCSAPRSAPELAEARGISVPVTEARLERLRRAGYVQISALGVDTAGRPRIAYTATSRPFNEPLLAARG